MSKKTYRKFKKCKDCENKGVTATASDIQEALAFQEQTQNIQVTDGIENVRDELKTVIELMGPSTPHFPHNTSSEADNEESVYSSASFYSSIVKVKQVNKNDAMPKQSKHLTTDTETPRDISQMSALPTDPHVSELMDNCSCDRSYEEIVSDIPLGHLATCPCRQYMKSVQDTIYNKNILNEGDTIAENPPNVQGSDLLHMPTTQDGERRYSKEKAINLLNFLKFKRPSKEFSREPLDLYKLNILQPNDSHSPPKRVVFELIDDIPKPEVNTVATNTAINKPINIPKAGVHSHVVQTPYHSMIVSHKASQKDGKPSKHTFIEKMPPSDDNPTRVDVYYFDHGNAAYLRTTDSPPVLITELLAERTETYTAKFWAQFFGTVHIGFAFFTSFVLQFFRFILQSFFRPLTIGVAQLASDYFFKPLLTVLFNAIIQPPLIFLFNIATSLRDLCDPLAEGVGYFLREIANIFRAVRLVEVKQDKRACCENACHAKHITKDKAKTKCTIPCGP